MRDSASRKAVPRAESWRTPGLAATSAPFALAFSISSGKVSALRLDRLAM